MEVTEHHDLFRRDFHRIAEFFLETSAVQNVALLKKIDDARSAVCTHISTTGLNKAKHSMIILEPFFHRLLLQSKRCTFTIA